MSDVRDQAVSVLVVDDHASVRKSLRQLLKHRGMQVVGEAADGDEAVRLCQRLRPDAVVLDIVMPVLNGFEAARKISRLSPDIKIIFLSVLNTETCVGEAFRVGGAAYVNKQHAAYALHEAIEAALQGKTYISKAA